MRRYAAAHKCGGIRRIPAAADNPSPHGADALDFVVVARDLLLRLRWVSGPLQSSAKCGWRSCRDPRLSSDADLQDSPYNHYL